MAEDIGQSFLNDAENGGFDLRCRAEENRAALPRGKVSNAAALCESLQVPLQRGMQTDFVEQRRMQKMRNAAHLLDGVIDERARVGGGLLLAVPPAASAERSRPTSSWPRQILPQAIVQFASDAAALFILRRNQAAGEAAQLVVQHFELLRLAVQLGKNADFRSQQFRDQRERKCNLPRRARSP